MNINKPSVPMKSNPIATSCLETECLFGEEVKVLDEKLEWYFCELSTDKYKGWIEKKNLSNMEPYTHRVIAKRTHIYQQKNIKSNSLHYLPLGGQVSVKNIDERWAEINIYQDRIFKTGYVLFKNIIEKDSKVKDWVGIAEQLIGTPYLWGGRDSIALDCSALLQLSYQAYGENIPRNSIDQSLLNKKIIK